MLDLIISAFLVQCVALAYLVRLYRFPGRGFNDVIPYLRHGHQSELQDLLDPIKEENLISALGHKRFRKEQSKRIHLAHEVIAQRAHNARVFQEWGYTESERAIQNLNSEAGENATVLIDACLYYRVNACIVQARLYAWYSRMAFLPFTRVPRISTLGQDNSFNLMDSYKNVQRAAEHLASACGGECRHALVRTLGTMREGTTDATWMTEARILQGGL
jgi:hypothetical protein